MKSCRMLFIVLAVAGAISTGCQRKPADDHGHEHDDDNWSVTAWGEHYEIFAECDPLIAGKVAYSHTHVTVLDTFSPLRHGVVTAILRTLDGTEQAFVQEAPVRDGIFSIEINPTEVSVYELSFRVEGASGHETIAAGEVTVGTATAPGELVHRPQYGVAVRAPSTEQPVSFLKEQQWRTPFRTAWAVQGEIRGAVRGLARVRPAAGAEAILTAPLDGIIGTDSRLYIGRRITKGAVLLQLGPRAGSNRTLVELEAEADVAKRRLARLEELLQVEAVSSAEVEAARARLSALEAQLQAAQGVGGATSSVRAPITGEIAEVHVIPGQAVSAGDPLVRIVRRTPLWLEVAVLPAETSRLSATTGLVVGVPGSPLTLVATDSMRLVSLSPEVDPATGKVAAIIEVTQRLPVQVGTIVETEILLADSRSGVIVPASALVDDSGVQVVYVQVDGESFQRRPVEILGRQAEKILVTGVNAGERVVTDGGGTIRRHALMSTGPVEGHVH